ncbi:hypothetical protein ZIOFF_075003 [Zingiber officinale]|uniref:Uncharacterized protein n=1 Tax=Zingiber officinale TaxID=94328 RepID=A0A8J5EN30_ZINOF|nr:hypothetical protein ZIOFF_075003 [Zingiber officinale]
MAGSHTVLLFNKPPRLHNAQGAVGGVQEDLLGACSVVFSLDVCKDLSVANEKGSRRVPLGSHVLSVGDLKHTFSLTV